MTFHANHALAAAAFLIAMVTLSGNARGQDTEADLAQLRGAMRAQTINGCVAALTEPAVAIALRKAKEAGRTDLTEESVRKTLGAGTMLPIIEGTCRCALADLLARLDNAKTAAELESVPDEFLANGLTKMMRDQDRIKACAPNLPTVTPRVRPATSTWVKVGTWQDGDGFVDSSSVKSMAQGRVQAWTKAEFATPKALGKDVSLLSVQVLQNFDCANGTAQSVSFYGFEDRDGVVQAYKNDKPDTLTAFERTEPGTRGDALLRWACTFASPK